MSWLDFVNEQWLLLSVLAALIATLIWHEGRKAGQPISFHEVTRMLNQEEGLLVDVRDSAEYKSGHIVGALNIPHSKLMERVGELKKYREKTIIITDKLGQHAGAAGRILKQHGFEVRRLQGGMSEWTQQNLPVVSS